MYFAGSQRVSQMLLCYFSEMDTEDAVLIYNQARAYARRFAIVHIASAQFEVDKGNTIDKK